MSNAQNNSDQIDWNNIFILDELYPYIDTITLLEFRIMSKFIYQKLRRIVFSKVYLIGENISRYFNSKNLNSKEIKVLENYSGYLGFPYNYFTFEDEIGLGLINNREYGISNKLFEEIGENASFIKVLEVKSVKECFYYLHSTAFTLSNLTSLKLTICTIPLLSILKIGNHLQNLKKLILKSITFIELNKQEISVDLVNFPQSLEYLLIQNTRIERWNYTPKINNLIDPRHPGGPVEVDYFQGIKIPNLKKLRVGNGNSSNFIRKLLKYNTEIEELIFDDFVTKQAVFEQISQTKTLTKFKLLNITPEFPYIAWDTYLPIPELPAITKLELGFQYLNFASNPKFCNISKYFPNLKELTIDLNSLNIEKFDINNFISKNLGFFNSLDVFRIADCPDHELNNPYPINFNWNNFVKTKCLILKLSSLPLSKIDFNVFPDELKEIRKQCKMWKLE
ncbi:hypothetical protein CONCODRAFT_169403 [Conidiobolus coronatus NRRL 28638]|uniref:RNI-like protein n=1 Tax=Conidiobolus coronatus (strain ATCC 28846 / CBS 209.66 / NRRL 28638) TaxID=796925 RepID=A0A137NRT8_CONC2|nr:hypothetical protein CONCODRAFT_169403 [Conidiobolus coronatus NRRL 28638]|eukprot:KXN65457.1 hypothetical protein CONCODRAFT_169403 [Conidiobolus coronatus NRRL 28638]